MRFVFIPIVLAITLLGCTPRGAGPRAGGETRGWETEEGRQHIRTDLARWYLDHHHPERALEILKTVREEGGSGYEVDLIHAEAMLEEGTFDQAILQLERLSAERPRDARPLQALGIAYADDGDLTKGTEVLERALLLDDADSATLNNLGFLHYANQNCGRSKELLQRSLELDGTQTRTRNNLAFALVCTGDHREALRMFRSTAPEADARYNLGVAYERIGEMVSALTWYQEAVTSDPLHPKAVPALARIGDAARADADTVPIPSEGE